MRRPRQLAHLPMRARFAFASFRRTLPARKRRFCGRAAAMHCTWGVLLT